MFYLVRRPGILRTPKSEHLILTRGLRENPLEIDAFRVQVLLCTDDRRVMQRFMRNEVDREEIDDLIPRRRPTKGLNRHRSTEHIKQLSGWSRYRL